jgi:Zn-finger protein
MELQDLYEMLAKNIIYEMKQRKENVIKKFLKNFSCKSTCAIAEDDHFEIIMEHIKKLENVHKDQLRKMQLKKEIQENKISRHSII